MVLFVFPKLSISLVFIEQCWKYLFLGIVQGFTEFLPISSTGHLAAIPFFFGWNDPGVAVMASLQLGSIVAVILYFRSDLKSLLSGLSKVALKNNFGNSNSKLALAVSLGTLPIVFSGMIIKIFWKGYESSIIRSIPAIAIVSIVMSLLLLLAEMLGKRIKKFDDLKVSDGIIIGFAQVLALIPGVSRSGITITAALINGWERKSAARFSFLLGIPAISLAGLVELKDAFGSFYPSEVIPLLLGIVSSSITSWLAIDFLMRFLQKQNMLIFITYRFLFGVFLLIWYPFTT